MDRPMPGFAIFYECEHGLSSNRVFATSQPKRQVNAERAAEASLKQSFMLQ